MVLARFNAPGRTGQLIQPTLAGDDGEALSKAPDVTAGRMRWVSFIKKSSATTLELLQPFERERLDPITPVGIPELDRVTVEGPFNPAQSARSPSRQRVFTCTPASDREATPCARTILSAVARHAYRGPVSETETTRLLSFYEKERARGGSFDQGVESALTFLLVSPRFLYRVEQDPAVVARGASYRINDVELASRLSFFLWSSIPDDELLDLAIAGRLRQPAVVEQQVRRMLKDERSRALGSNFAGQWLFLRNLRGLQPDADVYPDFDHNLREAMQRETEMLFESVVLEDKSVLRLLDADYTYVNERLARNYGIPNVYGTQFRKVAISDEARRGLLGQGSILALTSQNNRISGRGVANMCLTTIRARRRRKRRQRASARRDAGQGTSMRDRMEEHRRNPVRELPQADGSHRALPRELRRDCRWRTDNGAAIDASAQLATARRSRARRRSVTRCCAGPTCSRAT